MTVSPPGYWLLDRMIFLTNKILRIINEKGIEIITNLLKDNNTFTGINTFTGGINVDSINSINGNTTFNSKIFINGNITSNNGTFIGNTLNIDIIEKNTTSNVTFKNNINMNNNNIYDVDTIFSNTLNIHDISLKSSSLQYITVNDDITFIKDINVNGNLIVDGSTFTVNRETLTINDRFIVLNANIENSSINYTDPAGIIVNTHNSSVHSKGYLLWTLFDPNDPSNEELNRTWDLSGDNLRGNVLKATTLRGNILDSYYSPNISVISDIDMNNKDISNINTITASDLNIDVISKNTAANITVISNIDMSNNDIYDVDTIFGNTLNINQIKTNPAANISVLNTIDMNNNYIINAIISTNSPINVEGGIIEAQNLILGGFDSIQQNEVLFRSRYGLNLLGTTKVVLDQSDTLYLPENNGVPFGSNNSNHTQSIIGIGGLSKVQENYQQLLNSQCYLIPPSMIPNDIPELRGNTLFETIGETNQRIRHLAGYNLSNNSINQLKNSLVPTVGQIVDLLNYLGVHMNGKQTNLTSN